VWAMPCVPYAGSGVGFCCLPDPGTGVWVEFEAGDPSYPIWSGCFWGDGDLPAGAPEVKFLITNQLELKLDDANNQLDAVSSGGGQVSVNDQVATTAGSGSHIVSGSSIESVVGSSKISLDGTTTSVNEGALEVT
jgi:uncharacterized protein involved in type VI secretion and phage assembly